MQQYKESALFVRLRAARPFFLIAGPGVIEGEEHCLQVCGAILEVVRPLGMEFVFKASFDRPSCTGLGPFRGPGMAEGLRILKQVKEVYGVAVCVDIHEPSQAEPAAETADMLQIPAYLCRQTDLLVAAARTGRIVHIEKGQICSPSVMSDAAAKVRSAGNPNVCVCECGTSFGYNDLVLDPRSLALMRGARCPVLCDITRALPSEGGNAQDLVPALARTAVAVGVDGIVMEVHNDPERAPAGGPTQWPLRHARQVLKELIAIAEASRGREHIFDI